jgi:GT2 family glycosyltransferase
MDGDDVWLPHALETLLERLERRPGAIGSHGLAEFIDANDEVIDEGSYSSRGRERLGRLGRRLTEWPLDQPTEFDVLINGNVLFPPGLLLTRRSAYEAAGPFDESFSRTEDWAMLIRLSRQGPLEFVNEVILHYRRHDQNLEATGTVARQAWIAMQGRFILRRTHPSSSMPPNLAGVPTRFSWLLRLGSPLDSHGPLGSFWPQPRKPCASARSACVTSGAGPHRVCAHPSSLVARNVQ